MSNRILAITAALAIVALILWLVVPDRRTVPSMAINASQEASPSDLAERLSITSRAASAPALTPPAPARPEPVAESRGDSSPVSLSNKDRSFALFLSRLDHREYEDVVSLITTQERLDALRDRVSKFRSRDQAARRPAQDLAYPIADQKFNAGEYTSSSTPPHATESDGVTICRSSMDPTTKESVFRAVTVGRGTDPALDAALDKRDAELAQIRAEARALIDSWK